MQRKCSIHTRNTHGSHVALEMRRDLLRFVQIFRFANPRFFLIMADGRVCTLAGQSRSMVGLDAAARGAECRIWGCWCV